MRIACISASQVPSLTANSIQVMKAVQALAQLGHEVQLWVPASGAAKRGKLGSINEEAKIDDSDGNLPWDRLATLYGLQTPFKVQAIPAKAQFRRYDFSLGAVFRARSWKADLIYAWPLQAAVFGLSLGMPEALELHGPPEGKLGPGLFRLLRRMRGKKRFLPITQGLVELLLRQDAKPFLDDEVVISPNGVDLERYQSLPEPASARLALGLPEVLTVGYSGHLYPGRGMGLLFELAKRIPKVQFLWVGGREVDVQAWREKLNQEGVSNVVLTGFVQNQRLPLYQAAADILLMPYERVITGSSGGNSADYCSPMKMFEYMACGRAILSSDLPVLHEVLNEANCAFCVPEDIDSWAKGLEILVQHPEKRIQLAAQAQRDAQGYTWFKRAQNALAGFP